MTRTENKIKEQERYARKACFWIGIFGMFLLLPFNLNFHLVKTGNKIIAKVVNIEKRWDENVSFVIDIEYLRQNEEFVERRLNDYTGGDFLFFIDEGDSLTIYESKNQPYKCYAPYVSFMPKVFLAIFFVFIPFIFMIFGKSTY